MEKVSFLLSDYMFHKHELDRMAGVYLCFDVDGKPLYIGHSFNLWSRINGRWMRHADGLRHWYLGGSQSVDPGGNWPYAREKCLIEVRFTIDPRKLEKELISLWKPEYNIRGKKQITWTRRGIHISECLQRLTPSLRF